MSRISIYKYDCTILELNNCRAKLNRCKLEITRLVDGNIKLKKLLAEESPLHRNPVDVLKHAARYIRSNKGYANHEAVMLLFRKAGECDEERSRPYRVAAHSKNRIVEDIHEEK